MLMFAQTEFQERLSRAWQLLPAYSRMENIPLEDVRMLAEALLDLKAADNTGPYGRSALNADQAPLQLCITLSPGGTKYRLIADPASDDLQASSRYIRSLGALKNIMNCSRSQDMESLVGGMLERFGPGNIPAESFEHGVFWLAASVREKGMAVYLDTSVYPGVSAWDKAENWLLDTTKNSDLGPRLRSLREYCWISSLGIEGYCRERSRIKLYLRSYRDKNIPQGAFGNLFPPLAILGKSGCLRILMRNLGMDTRDIFYNVGIHSASGELMDVKIDMAGAGLKLDRENAKEVLRDCCKVLNLQEVPADVLLREYNLCISFIGVGVDRDEVPRLNIYLKGSV